MLEKYLRQLCHIDPTKGPFWPETFLELARDQLLTDLVVWQVDGLGDPSSRTPLGSIWTWKAQPPTRQFCILYFFGKL